MDKDSPARFMMGFLTCVAGLLALLVIGTICYTAVAPGVPTDNKALGQLQNWGGVIIGFFFGSFFNLFAEVIKGKPNEPRLTPPINRPAGS